jgi:RHS repeat-associated protein
MLIGIQDANAADVTNSPVLRIAYTYTGRESESESGLYFYRARLYDPYSGRFLQKDPSPGRLDLSVSVVNAYAYVGNNPANRIDPSGMSWLSNNTFGKFVGQVVWGLAVGGAFALGSIAGGPLGGILAAALVGGLMNMVITDDAPGSFRQGFITGAVIGAAIAIGGAAGASYGKWAGAGLGALGGAAVGAAAYQTTGIGTWWQGALVGGLTGGIVGYQAGLSGPRVRYGSVSDHEGELAMNDFDRFPEANYNSVGRAVRSCEFEVTAAARFCATSGPVSPACFGLVELSSVACIFKEAFF